MRAPFGPTVSGAIDRETALNDRLTTAWTASADLKASTPQRPGPAAPSRSDLRWPFLGRRPCAPMRSASSAPAG